MSVTDWPDVADITLEGEIGSGGFATVYAGRSAGSPPLAVKVARAANELSRTRMDIEAAALQAIGAPHTPALWKAGLLADGRPFVAMERLFGKPLDAVLGAALALDRISQLAAATARSLRAMHEVGLIHRDLKPANLFLVAAATSQVRLLDFGLAMATGAPPAEMAIAGTSPYMSPEQLRADGALSEAVDIYALGVILYEMLVGAPPFVGDRATVERGHLALRPPPLREVRAIPSELEALCLACLRKDPSQRPALPELIAYFETAIRLGEGAPASEVVPLAQPTVQRTLQAAHSPIVLLAIDDGGALAGAAVNQRGGFLARRHDRQQVFAFGIEGSQPARAALDAAREIIAATPTARAALHLANLRVRPGKPARLYGRELEEPASWIPAADASIDALIAMTAEFIAVAPASDEGDVRQAHASRFLGREDIMDRGRAIHRAVIASQTPALLTIVGDRGAGLSRLAIELANSARSSAAVIEINGRTGERELADQLRVLAERSNLATVVDASLAETLVAVSQATPIALIVDDGHHASDQLLDVIEQATLDRDATPLWVLVCANRALLSRRRQWGKLANVTEEIGLGPLAREAARELAAQFLEPAEYPPLAALDRFVDWAGSSPYYLQELARALARSGAIRQRDGAESFYLSTAMFEELPGVPLGQWLIRGELDQLPQEVASLARVCVVLGDQFGRAELAAVLAGAEAVGTRASNVDLDVGLAELTRAGILTELGDESWAFRHPAFSDSLYRLLEKSDREALHRHALDFWRLQADVDGDGADDVVLAVARHAAASGAHALAVESFQTVAERVRAAHHYEAADRYYSQAIASAESAATELACHSQLLTRRGNIRVKSYRLDEAIADLERARALATTPRATLEAVLELATAFDFAEDIERAATAAASAATLRADIDDPILAARCALATARTIYRAERWSDAAAALKVAADLAERAGDPETQAAARLILATSLVVTGDLDDAEREFDKVIASSEARGDRVHLAIAYSQRSWLWSAREEPSRGIDELRLVVEIAREVGQPQIERFATHNLSEMLHWSGESREARRLAERGFELQRRFASKLVAADALLLARVVAAAGDVTRARELLDWIAEHIASVSPSSELMIEMVGLAIERAEDAAWLDLTERAKALPDEERREIRSLWTSINQKQV